MGFQKDGDLDNSLISLDDFRIRSETAFETHPVAYVEAVWGKDTMAFNAAIQDLEAMRRGLEGELRPPETYHEVQHLVLHIRGLANDLARHFGLEDLVHEADDRNLGVPTLP